MGIDEFIDRRNRKNHRCPRHRPHEPARLPGHHPNPRRGRGVAPAGARLSRAGHQRPAAPSARALVGGAGRRVQPRAGPARLAWHHLAARIWRRWPQPVCALCAGGGIPQLRRARGCALDRRSPKRPADPEVRHRGAKAVLPAAHLPGRGVLLYRHERAWRRLGPGERENPGPAQRTGVPARWPEDLDHQRPALPVHDRAGAQFRGGGRGGFSGFIVGLVLGGVSVRRITALAGDSHFCEVFFDQVQLSPEALIGQEGQGWEQVTAELAFERSGPERLFSSIVLFDQWLAWVRTPQGRSQSALRLAGQVFTQLAPLRAMSVSIQQQLMRGASPVVPAALVKELGTTLEQYIPATIADDLFARDGAAEVPLELLRTLNYVTGVAPSFSLRGGT